MADRRALATDVPSSKAVYRLLRNRIMTCELVPGQLLTERRSAVELGLALLPVRDALTRLVRDRLVQAVSPNAYRITPLAPKSVHDPLAVWALLGPEMAALGTSRADPEQAAELGQLWVNRNAVLVGPLDRDRVDRSSTSPNGSSGCSPSPPATTSSSRSTGHSPARHVASWL
jgi:DNA-binding GntR family transcriptional regulator